MGYRKVPVLACVSTLLARASRGGIDPYRPVSKAMGAGFQSETNPP